MEGTRTGWRVYWLVAAAVGLRTRRTRTGRVVGMYYIRFGERSSAMERGWGWNDDDDVGRYHLGGRHDFLHVTIRHDSWVERFPQPGQHQHVVVQCINIMKHDKEQIKTKKGKTNAMCPLHIEA
ncbi:hypothetical protein VTJ04DRAFT_1392 [Mycothermus thermophilus]|uniref:uncharacterized protein n=1 Tax=Humicola insolens TaxID=85995 RepID=UPI003741EE54